MFVHHQAGLYLCNDHPPTSILPKLLSRKNNSSEGSHEDKEHQRHIRVSELTLCCGSGSLGGGVGLLLT